MITKETKNRIDTMVALIKENKDGISAESLAKAVGLKNAASIYNFVLYHKENLPMGNIKSSSKGYVWVEPEKDESKNKEGYSDPTVTKALNNLKKYSFKESKYEPGVVYRIETLYDNRERLVLVLSGYPGTVNCLEVQEVTGLFYDPEICIVLPKFEKYYVDPRRVISVAERCFAKEKFFVDDVFFKEVIKTTVAKCLGIDEKIVTKTVKVPVEKIVTKTVKVPVEKVVEVEKIVEVPKKEIQIDFDLPVKNEMQEEINNLKIKLQVAEETGRIWKKALYAVTGYKEGLD